MATILISRTGRVYPGVRNTFVRRLFSRLFVTKVARVKRMSL